MGNRANGYRISGIEGIGPATVAVLGETGIVMTADLLTRCGSARGRKEIAVRSGISEARLLKWAQHADLMRIRGIGGQYCELPDAAGVDTVKKLRQRNAEHLAAEMRAVNRTKGLTQTLPSPYQVKGWIGQAKGLDPAIAP